MDARTYVEEAVECLNHSAYARPHQVLAEKLHVDVLQRCPHKRRELDVNAALAEEIAQRLILADGTFYPRRNPPHLGSGCLLRVVFRAHAQSGGGTVEAD